MCHESHDAAIQAHHATSSDIRRPLVSILPPPCLLLGWYNGMVSGQISLVRRTVFLHPRAAGLGRRTVQVQRHGGYRAGWIAHLVIAQVVGDENDVVAGSQRALMRLSQQGRFCLIPACCTTTVALDVVPSGMPQWLLLRLLLRLLLWMVHMQ
jgi:hypothetical protein